MASTKGWRGLGRHVTVVLGIYLTSGIGACADLPTASVPQARPMVGPSISIQKPFPQGRGLVQAVCITSEATPDGPFAYEYSRVTVSLPVSARAPNGKTTSYRYRGYAGEQVVLAGNCRIPDSEMAVARMNRLFGQAEGPARRSDGDATGLKAEAAYILDGLEVYACQYGGEWPNCASKSPTRVMSIKDAAICTDFECDTGFEPMGGGSNSSPPPPDDEDGPLLWGACILAVVGSGISISQVSDKFDAWYTAYKDAEGLQRLWQATVESGADPLTQQLYEYQYKQARQRQEDAKGAVSEATGVTWMALAGAAVACGASVLLPTP